MKTPHKGGKRLVARLLATALLLVSGPYQTLIIATVGFVAVSRPAFAAIAASTNWEVQSAGVSSNGGGYDGNNANGFTDGAATSATGNSPVFTSASYNFVAGDAGHFLVIHSGTNWTPGEYPIASVAANAATLSAAVGAAETSLLSSIGASMRPNTVAGCATTASPTGATWAIDYSRSTSPWSYTDLVQAGSTTLLTSVAHPFGKQQCGNIINITSGTGFTVERVQIVSVSTVTATVTPSTGGTVGVGGNGTFGGPLDSPGTAAGMPLADQMGVYVKGATYNIGGGTQNTSGNKVNTSFADRWVGYNAVRGDDGTAPVFKATADGIEIFKSTGNPIRIENIVADGDKTNRSNVTCWKLNGGSSIYRRLTAQNANNDGFDINGSNQIFYDCLAKNCAGSAGFQVSINTGCVFINCVADTNVIGFLASISSGTVFYGCIATANTSTAFATSGSSFGCVFDHDIAYVTANNQTGFQNDSKVPIVRNCIAVATGTNATGFGFNSGTNWGGVFQNCAVFGQSAGNNATSLGALDINAGLIVLTANPFTNAPTDFSLNNTTGGGPLLKALGLPATYNGLASTLTYPDVGAAQSQSTTTTTTKFGITGG